MKKIITVLGLCSLFCTSLFAENFFSKRIFEFKLDVPVSVSNNAFGLSDILKKEVELNLTDIANKMPKSGLNFVAKADPSISMNLNLPLFKLGFSISPEMYGKFGIGKGLFDFLGTGYDIGDELKVAMDANADLFVAATVKAGFDVGFLSVEVKPSLFVPIFHVASDDCSVVLQNTENGDISLDANAKLNAYAIAGLDMSNIDMSTLSAITGNIGSSLGFDIGGTVHFNYFDNLDLWGSARVPMVPGHLAYSATFNAYANYEGNISELIASMASASSEETDTDSEETTEESSVTGLKYGMDDFSTLAWSTDNKYYINRPMKLDVYATYKLIPSFIEFTGGIGAGIRNPFAKNQHEVDFYPEYYLASQVGIANILVVKFSTEYTDEVFIHQLALKFNLRLIELDAGASLQSGNFASSFKVAGAGVFVTGCIGF